MTRLGPIQFVRAAKLEVQQAEVDLASAHIKLKRDAKWKRGEISCTLNARTLNTHALSLKRALQSLAHRRGRPSVL
jgi:hypothetical protein